MGSKEHQQNPSFPLPSIGGQNTSITTLIFIFFLPSNIASCCKEMTCTIIYSFILTRIIGIVDTVGLKLVVGGTAQTILSPAVALSVKPADGANFQKTTFSISSPTNVEVRKNNFHFCTSALCLI